MATSPSVALFNTDPNVQAQAALIAQRQAMAQELLKQGMTPIETNNRQIGGVGYHISPMEGLAKLLQTYTGQKGVQQGALAQGQLAAQAYGNLLNRYQPGSPASYSPEQIQGANSGAMDGDGMGPPDPSKIATALMGQSPSQGGANPNNPMGIPPQILAQRNAGMMDDETFKALVAPYMATDASKAAIQGGFSPTTANQQTFAKGQSDPKIWAMQQAGLSPQQIQAAAIGQAAKDAEIERKPGNQFVNGVLGTSGVVPKIPEGANPVGGVAPNGALPGGVAPMAGAAPIIQQNAQAGATGTANGGIHTVETRGGAKIPMRGSEIPPADADRAAIFNGELQKAQAQLASAKTPEERSRAQADVDGITREAARYRIPLGQSTADKVTQEAGAKTLVELPQQITQTKQTITGLENGLRTLEALKASGPGMSKGVNALAMVNNMGIPLMSGDVNGYQTLKKFLENSAASAAAAGGFTGSDARFEQFKAGQPNAESMNPQALEGAIRYVLSQQDAALHQSNHVLNSASGDATKAQTARQQWAQEYNPRYFEMQRLSPTEQKSAVSSMSPQEAAAFLQWRKAQKAR